MLRHGVFLMFLSLYCSLASASEFRGIWVDAFGPGFFNAQQVKKLVEDCRKYNFNAVLVEMRRRGDSFYSSNFDPRTTIITTNFDALAAIIKECHTGTPRIEVHCWVVSHFIWAWEKPPIQPNHVFNKHPEYLTKDFLGQKFVAKGYYLDPGNPDANLTIYQMAKDIVSRYDIDGFHWDYCRYPTQDSGYNETAIKRYNEEFGLTGLPTPKDPKFSEWRRRQVTDFLRWVNADLWEIKPNLVISASVFANLPDAYGYRFSDWPTWNKEGIIDVCMPMDFSINNQNVFMPRADVASTNQGIRKIYLGQAGYMNTPENTIIQLDYARAKEFVGTVFYSYRTPNTDRVNQEATFSFIKERFQPNWADTPVLPWKKTRGIVKGTIVLKGSGRPVYNAVVSLNADPSRSLKSDQRGKFAFFDLEPRDYTLSAGIGTRKGTAKIEAKVECVVNIEIPLSD